MQISTKCAFALLASTLPVKILAQAKIDLGTAAPFGIVATSAITNTGLSVITGELGIYPNGLTSITGFPPGISGDQHGADAVANKAHQDAQTAYDAAAAQALTTDLTGQDLGGKTLTPGVYKFGTSVGITGPLVLDGANKPNSQFVFQIGSTLTTASASSVSLINGAKACNVFWQVGSSATLGTTTKFVGNILASASISLNSGVTVNGGLYALSGAVTLINDIVNAQNTCAPVTVSTDTASPPSSTPAANSPSTGTTTSSTFSTPTSTSSAPAVSPPGGGGTSPPGGGGTSPPGGGSSPPGGGSSPPGGGSSPPGGGSSPPGGGSSPPGGGSSPPGGGSSPPGGGSSPPGGGSSPPGGGSSPPGGGSSPPGGGSSPPGGGSSPPGGGSSPPAGGSSPNVSSSTVTQTAPTSANSTHSSTVSSSQLIHSLSNSTLSTRQSASSVPESMESSMTTSQHSSRSSTPTSPGTHSTTMESITSNTTASSSSPETTAFSSSTIYHHTTPAPKIKQLTTYTTVYSCTGPTGLEEKTYLVTETCSTPGLPHPTGYIPQDFTVVTVKCTACAGQPSVTVTTPVTTYTTTYPCTGSTGLEEKTYTVTEPCPTQGVAHTAGYIPQDFTVTTVQCTLCAGQPSIAITTPVTTYTTTYPCTGSTGLEEKIYTVTEPCPTQGVARAAGYIPQDFTVTAVQCTPCAGHPWVAITTPVAHAYGTQVQETCPTSCLSTITNTVTYTRMMNHTLSATFSRYWAV